MNPIMKAVLLPGCSNIFMTFAWYAHLTVLTFGQLKIMQEVITLGVFVPFSLFYLKEPLKLDYLWAGLCLMGAVFFIFRSRFA